MKITRKNTAKSPPKKMRIVPKKTTVKSPPPKQKSPPIKKKASSSSGGGDGGGGGKISEGGAPQRIIDLILSIETTTQNPNVPRKMVVAMAGIKSNTFPVTISNMKNKHGLITYDRDTVRLTDKGRAQARPTADVAFDNTSAQEELKKTFKIGGGMASRLFEVLQDGKVHDRSTVADAIGCTNKQTFGVMLSNWKKFGIIIVDRTTVQMADVAFPFGRPE